MSRLSTLNSAAASAPHVPYALFVSFNFVSGFVRLTSFDQDYTFGGNTYTSLGKMCQLGDYPETADLTPSSITFTLSGVDSSLLATVLTEAYHNRDAQLYIGWLDSNNALIDTPYLLWEGFMDSMQIHSDESTSSISLVCESRLLLWAATAGWMYSDVHQKQFKSGDSFFNLVASLVNKTVNWGGAAPASANVGSPVYDQSPPLSPPGPYTPT